MHTFTNKSKNARGNKPFKNKNKTYEKKSTNGPPWLSKQGHQLPSQIDSRMNPAFPLCTSILSRWRRNAKLRSSAESDFMRRAIVRKKS